MSEFEQFAVVDFTGSEVSQFCSPRDPYCKTIVLSMWLGSKFDAKFRTCWSPV